MALQWTETEHAVAGVALRVLEAGEGSPVLILHHDIGTLEQLPFYDLMARSHRLLLPIHPGWGRNSQRAEWMRSVRDIAVLYRLHLATQGLERVHLLGLGFGGWIAAEMATMAAQDVGKLILVGAMGVQPAAGFILDMAVEGYLDYARAFFHDPGRFDEVYGEPTGDMLESFDICREMCFRVAWKPYMFSQTLPNLLQSMPVQTLVVWGKDDKVVPMECCDRYMTALPNARRELVADCGHAVDMEQPDVLAGLAAEFLKG